MNLTPLNDLTVGHLLVLLQYDWPKNEKLFCDIIRKIQQQGRFQYKSFMQYITCRSKSKLVDLFSFCVPLIPLCLQVLTCWKSLLFFVLSKEAASNSTSFRLPTAISRKNTLCWKFSPQTGFIDFVLHLFRSRTVTRGVNKNVNEDFRAAMDQQVLRCSEPVTDIIRDFLNLEESLGTWYDQ